MIAEEKSGERFIFVERPKEVMNEESEVEIFQGLEIKGDKIFGYDSSYKCLRWVGIIDHLNKTVKPTHGYYLPNMFGKKVQKYALKVGYEFKEK